MQLKFATFVVLASLAVSPVLSQPIDHGLVHQNSTRSSHSLDKPPHFDFGRFMSGVVEMVKHYIGLRRSYVDLVGNLEVRGIFSEPDLDTREIPEEYDEYVARDLEDELEAREFDDAKYWGGVAAQVVRRDLDAEKDYWSDFVLHELEKREQEERELYEDM